MFVGHLAQNNAKDTKKSVPVRKGGSMAKKRKRAVATTESESPVPHIPFEKTQEEKDWKLRQLVAEWAVREGIRPNDGSRIVFDAGSSCLAVWERLLEEIRQKFDLTGKA